VHPAYISVVAYLSARGDLLSAFFILFCCILFLNFLDTGNFRLYFLSILSAFFAFLSRENALIIIFLLSSIILLRPQAKKKIKYLGGFCIVYLIYFGIRLAVFGSSGLAAHPAYLTVIPALANFSNIILRYLLLLVCPVNLRMFHSYMFVNKITFQVIYLVLAGLILLWLILLSRDQKKWLRFSLFWFLSGVIPVYFCFSAYPALGGALAAESWLYLPSIGFFTALAYFCLLHKYGRFIIYGCVLILSILVFENRQYWRNELDFCQRTARFLPAGSFIQKNLALAYIQKGDFTRADQTIQKLQSYYPDSPLINSLWGQYYLATGDPGRGLNFFQSILVKNFFTNYSVSLCYSKLGDFSRAIVFSQASFSQNNYYLPNIIQLASLYTRSGREEDAAKFLSLAKKLDPGNRGFLLK
jgi:tetratricopeptide (TPR) repeat protein